MGTLNSENARKLDTKLPVWQIQRDWSPKEIVQLLAKDAGAVVLIFLDLDDGNWTVETAATWLKGFILALNEITLQKATSIAAPPVVVFGTGIDDCQTEEIRRAGGILYDRSFDCNPKNADELIAYMDKTHGGFSERPETRKPAKIQPNPDADPDAFNGYPQGVSEEDLDKWFKETHGN